MNAPLLIMCAASERCRGLLQAAALRTDCLLRSITGAGDIAALLSPAGRALAFVEVSAENLAGLDVLVWLRTRRPHTQVVAGTCHLPAAEGSRLLELGAVALADLEDQRWPSLVIHLLQRQWGREGAV